jgi:hypothetical protein
MFESARPFPDYPYADTNIHTIFSTGFKTRFRASPDGVLGASIGAGNTINVFNLASRQMVAQVQFPAASSAIVQDVAFSRNGAQLFAVATLAERDTLFAVADVSNLTVTFRNPTMICDVVLVTLATSPSVSANVYAIGRGTGLYEINPQNVNTTPQPLYPFAAVGHMVVHDQSGNAFATVSTGGTADTYERVVRLNLRAVTNPTNPPGFAVAARDAAGAVVFTSGEDDIALTSQAAPSLYIVSGLSTTNANKQVAVYNGLEPNGSQTPVAFVDLGENTTIRLAHNPATNHMMATFEDSYRVGLITANHSLVQGFRHPVQISPLSIEMAPNRATVYVLNFASNTISAIPAARLQPGQQLPLQPLADYRSGVINAFADLLAGLLQFLKDCFCDHLLVNCPTCDEDDKLYLACITIRDGQVFKICNFSLRKYVHSFPTWEYWLSAIPILPFIRFAVERVCCAALPSLFGRFTAPRPKNAPDVVSPNVNRISSTQVRERVGFVRDTDFRGIFRDQVTRARLGAQLFDRTIADRSAPVPQPVLVHTDVINRPVDEARRRLEAGKVKVERVEIYDPDEGAAHLGRFLAAPSRLAEGASVILVTDHAGQVLYYKRGVPAAADVAALRTDLDKVRVEVADVATARPEITALRTRVEGNTTALSAMQTSVEEALRLRQEVATARTELAQVRKAGEDSKEEANREIARLQTSSRELTNRVEELQRKVDAMRTPRGPRERPARKKKPPEE